MRAVILGSDGQLGRELARQLPTAVALGRAALDITDEARLRATLEAAQPEVVFNATAYNRADAAEVDPLPAFAVNALAVHRLAMICRDLGRRLVHFSTNYVFGRDRMRRTPYREDDPVAPINAYGVSKAIGEDFVTACGPEHLVIRTAAMFAVSQTSRNNFLENMLAKSLSGDVVRVVNDQTLAPTRGADLAAGAIGMAAAKMGGIVHLNGPEPATWYELAHAFFELAGMGDRVRPVSSAELGAKAERPAYSVMSIDKYLSLGFERPMGWREAVEEYWRLRAQFDAEKR